MLLVVSNSADAHVAEMAPLLDASGQPWARLDTDRFTTDIRLMLDVEGAELRIADRHVDLADVDAVWWRRPTPPELAHPSPEVAAWASAEAHAALDSALRSIQGRWVNHPDRNRRAEDKPAAMRAAAEHGLRVPKWTVTNQPAVALAFSEAAPAGVVIKTLRRARVDRQRVLWTAAADDADLAVIGPEPYLVQHRLPKRLDIRIVVIGSTLTAVAIDSQADPASSTDVRAGGLRALDHHRIDVAPEVGECLRALVSGFDLQMAAVDFIVDADGHWWFVDLNPNGQWAWLSEAAGVDLHQQMAQLLLS